MQKTRHFPGSADAGGDRGLQGERSFLLLSHNCNSSRVTPVVVGALREQEGERQGWAFLSDQVPWPLSLSFHFQILPSRLLSSLHLVSVGEGSGAGRTHRGSCRISRFPENLLGAA